MINQFIVSRSFLKFLVTVNAGRVKVQTVLPFDSRSNISNTFANAEEMIVERYLRQERIAEKNVYSELLEYYSERQWLITEATDENIQVIAKGDVAA